MVPVVLFVYKRTDTLTVTLESLKRNRTQKLIVFSDAPRREDDFTGVVAVRKMVFDIDWCDVEVHLREKNMGLGASIKAGLSSVFERYDAAIVCEDDLEFVEGTIDYLTAALRQYANDGRVMSVTGYTNRLITPDDVGDGPYFDGRFECWLWGTWRRVWNQMQQRTAQEMMEMVRARDEDPYRWGGDLPYMAKTELAQNIWAVRMCYLHILNHGLCMRPPWSMVNHIGWGGGATNVGSQSWEYNGKLRPCPPLPSRWPLARVNEQCEALNRKMYKRPWVDVFPHLVPLVRRLLAWSRFGKMRRS